MGIVSHYHESSLQSTVETYAPPPVAPSCREHCVSLSKKESGDFFKNTICGKGRGKSKQYLKFFFLM